MTKINGPRYSDSKDFDEIHDKITLWLMDNYKKISQDVISKISQKNALFPKYDFINNENSVIKIDAGIKIESPLNQFNIPDAIVSGDIKVHHNGRVYFDLHEVISEVGQPTGQKEASLHCPVCRLKIHELYNNDKTYHIPSFTFPRSDGFTPLQALNEILESIESAGITCKDDNSIAFVWNDDFYCINKNFTIVFEVKSHIKSFGEVMRQLQSYKSALLHQSKDFMQVVLVTPDPRFNSYFEEQGFTVIIPDIGPSENKNNTKSLEAFTCADNINKQESGVGI